MIKYNCGRGKQKHLFGFVAVMVVISLFLVLGSEGEQNTPSVEKYINKTAIPA